MKIILKILAFIFLLNVNAHSELIYLTQCYVTDFKSSDGKIEKKVFKSPAEDESKNTDKKDQTYTLNTDTETITKTLINSDQKMLEYFDTYKILLPKIEKIQFDIQNISGNFITARPAILTGTTVEYKIDLSLSNSKVYSYIVKDLIDINQKKKFTVLMSSKEVRDGEIKMREDKAKFLTSVALNLSLDTATNKPSELSGNLAKWEKIFDYIHKGKKEYTQSRKETIDSKISKKLIEDLGVDKSLAKLLIEIGFSTVDDIRNRSIEDLIKVEGIDSFLAKTLIKRAKEFYQKNLITIIYTEQCKKS